MAILKKSKYLEKALLLYTRLGFTVESKPKKVLVDIPPYFSMILNLENKDTKKVDFDHEYLKALVIIT